KGVRGVCNRLGCAGFTVDYGAFGIVETQQIRVRLVCTARAAFGVSVNSQAGCVWFRVSSFRVRLDGFSTTRVRQTHPFLVVGGGCGGDRGVEMEKVMRWCRQWYGKMVWLRWQWRCVDGDGVVLAAEMEVSGGGVTVEMVAMAWRWCRGRWRCGVDSSGGVRMQGSGGAWWRVIYGIG
nr:hypothetical protein [Tanacetum cinerariifolium]